MDHNGHGFVDTQIDTKNICKTLMIKIKKNLEKEPGEMKIIFVEAVLMPNGEIICLGETIGFYEKIGAYTYEKDE